MLRRTLAARHGVAPVALAAVVALAVGCASPTLPLPPPLAPTVTPGADADHVTLTANCNVSERDVVMVVINEGGGGVPVPPGLAVGGALTDACGAWKTSVYAHRGDSLVLTYQLNSQISLPTLVAVR